MTKTTQRETEFYLNSGDINLNVSILAQSVLNTDDMIFSAPTQKKNFEKVSGGFINRVIKNMLACITEDNDDGHFRFSINEDMVDMRDIGAHFHMTLNNDTLNAINDFFETFDVSSDKITKPTLYLKALLENYARQAFIVRENILLKDRIDEIFSAIRRGKLLHLRYADQKFTVIPFAVVPSKEGTYHYLAAEMDGALKIFRISRIQDLSLGGRSKQIHYDKLKEYRERIAKFGPTFADKPVTTVKVRLTEEGATSYRYSVLHRPIHKKIETGNVYVFECSEQQAEYFFLRFAENAEILEPPTLREKFAKLYASGLKNHTDN